MVKTIIKVTGEEDFILGRNAVQILSEGTLDIDKPAVYAMCTKYMVEEDNGYFDKIKICFEKSWNEISLGQRIMKDYMRSCQTKEGFSAEYFDTGNRQFR